MKLASKKADKNDSMSETFSYLQELVVYIYLFCMLGIFPLYYKNQFSGIGNAKYSFFWNTSLIFIGVSVFLLILKMILQKTGSKDIQKEKNVSFWNKFSFPDKAVGIYGICVLISYLFSPYKDFALKGAAGWEMGLSAQLIFVALYFLLSKSAEYGYFILGVHMTASFATYILGILHRFEIDPLGMYLGLTLDQKVEFLSTMGQATWFSSYVCTGFAIGIAVFYLCHGKWLRSISGIYTAVSFGILVTQNSDSAFIALAGIMLLLGYFSLKNMERWCRFLEILCIMWGTFAGIGVLQRIFSDRAIPLDTLSVFFSQSIVTWLLLIVSLGMLFFYKKSQKDGKDQIMILTGKVYKGLLILGAVALAGVILFIILNTKGLLYKWFGYQSTGQYLLFNEQWGSYRGSIWQNVYQGFIQMTPLQKLFGVGPDSLSAYMYSIPEISESLYNLWGSVRLTNAHNEYLNSLICYGIVGLVSWLAVLVGGIRYFMNKAKEKPVMIMFALCIMGYACHNIFCYQQVCCTPLLFIFLGIGENLTKSEKFNTIK